MKQKHYLLIVASLVVIGGVVWGIIRLSGYNYNYYFIDKTGKIILSLNYDYVYDFSEGKARVVKNKKSGFIDKTGKEVIALQYDYAEHFYEGLVVVRQNGKYGVIDSLGNVVIPPEFDACDHYKSRKYIIIEKGEGKGKNKRKKQGLFYIPTRTITIPPVYDRLLWEDGLVRAKKGEKYGLIQAKTGEVLLPVKYRNVLVDNKYTTFFNDRYRGIYHHRLKKITLPMKYNRIGKIFSTNDKLVRIRDDSGLYGLADTEGNILVKPQYEMVSFRGVPIKIRHNNREGFIDKTGKILIPPVYQFARRFTEGLAAVKKNNLWGFIDTTGKLVIPHRFSQVRAFSYGLSIVEEGGKSKLIDREGKIQCIVDYPEVELFSSQLIGVRENGFWKLLNTSGKVISGSDFNELKSFETLYVPKHPGLSSGWVIYRKQDKWGLINPAGKIISEPLFDKTLGLHFVTSKLIYLPIMKDKKLLNGLINTQGKLLVPLKYHATFDSFKDTSFIIMKASLVNDTDMVLNAQGEILIAADQGYEDIGTLSEGLARVQKGGYSGYVDKKGKLVLPRIYFEASDFSEGLALVKLKKNEQ